MVKTVTRQIWIALFSVLFLLPSFFVSATFSSDWEANGVAIDSQGNIIVTGYIDEAGTLQFYTVKHSEEGGILWTQQFGKYGYNDAKDVAVDSQDNIIIVGAINDTNALLRGYDYCLVKYDSDGNELWDKLYHRKAYDTPLAVAVDSQDNIIMAGMSGRIDFLPELSLNLDFWTIKCDSNGNQLTENIFDGSELDTPFDVAVDSQDNIIVTGITNASGKLGYVTLKYSSSLDTVLWKKVYSAGFEDAGSAVTADSQDNIIVTGGSRDSTSLNYGTIKYTPQGSISSGWPKFYDSGGKDDARGVAVDFTDNIIITGVSRNEWFTIKYDGNGNTIWDHRPDIIGEARDVAVDGGNNIIVAGYKEENGVRRFYTIKYKANGDVLWDSTYSGSPPVAGFTWSQKATSRTIKFLDTSADDRGIQSWQWDFGDGGISYERNPEHTYSNIDTYLVTLTVTDIDENTDISSQQIDVSNLQPLVDFTYSPLNPTTNDTLSFFDNSIDYDGTIVSWLWDFDDGSTATTQDTSHTYSEAGNYFVTLTVQDNDGDTKTGSKRITINDSGSGPSDNVPPVANFTYSPTSPQPTEEVTFDAIWSYDPDGSIIWEDCKWDWDNDGIYDDTGIEADYTWDTEGNYDVTLQVTDNNGSTNTFTQTVHVQSGGPTADFSYTLDNLEVTFSDTSSDIGGEIVNHHWDFGDGSTSTEKNPTYTYTEQGTYTVILTVTDDDGLNATISKTFTLKEGDDEGGIPGFTALLLLGAFITAIILVASKKKRHP